MSDTKQREEQVEELKRLFNTLDSLIKRDANPLEALARCEQMIDDLSKHYPNDLNRIYFFTDNLFEKTVTGILKRGDISEPIAAKMNRYIQKVMFFLAPYVGRDIGPALVTIARVFSWSRTYIFYTHYGIEAEPSQFSNFQIYTETKDEEQEMKQILVRDRSHSWYLYSNVRWFIKLGILDSILERLKDKSRKLPLGIARGLLRIVARAREHCNPRWMEKYSVPILQYMSDYLLNLTDEDLKNEDKKAVSDILRYMEGLSLHDGSATREQLEQLRLEVDFKFLKCPYLEKRIQGLNDIRDTINAVIAKKEVLRHPMYSPNSLSYDPDPVAIDAQMMISWLKSKGIVEYLYGENLHSELIKRSSDILKFIAVEDEMTKEYIDLLWQASLTKHETICQIVWGTIKSLCFYLPFELMEYLFEKIKQIPVNEYTLNTLSLINELVSASIQSSGNVGAKRFWGLDFLWSLAQDDAKTSVEVANKALNCLQEFMKYPVCYPQRSHYISLCLQNLREGKSVTQSLQLLTKIFGTYPKRKDEKDSVVKLIDQLDAEQNLLQFFFKDLQKYKEMVQDAVNNRGTKVDINNLVIGKFTHLQHIGERLGFLDFVLGNSNIIVSNEQLDILWNCTIINALTPEERDMSFQWFENANSGNDKQFLSFTKPALQYLFEKKFPEIDMATLTLHGFNFFEYLFKTINVELKRFEPATDRMTPGRDFVVCTFDIVGIDLLWRICLEAHNTEVSQLAIDLLNRLYKSIAPALKPQLSKQCEEYLHRCMTSLATAAAEYFQRKNTDINVQLKISRCLSLIKAIIETFESAIQCQRHGMATRGIPLLINVGVQNNQRFIIQMYSNDTVGMLRKKIAEQIHELPEYLRLIASGKELSDDNVTLNDLKFVDNQHVYAIRHIKKNADGVNEMVPRPLPPSTAASNKSIANANSDDSTLPSRILSQDKYFEQLFQLLNVQGPVSAQVWDLLMKLPTNQHSLEQLRRLQTSAVQPNRPNWNELLDSRSLFKLLYSLQIVESLMFQEKSATDKNQLNEWCTQFVQSGGVPYLLQILLEVDFFDETRGNKRLACLASLLKVVNFFILTTPKSATDAPTVQPEMLSYLSTVNLSQLIHKLLDITLRAAVEQPQHVEDPTPGRLPTKEVDNDLVIRFAIPFLVATAIMHQDYLNTILSYPHFDTWLLNLLLLTPYETTRQQVAAGIYQICKQIANLQSIQTQFVPHKFFLSKLLSLLPTIQSTSTTCEQYFELLNKLVNDVCDGVGGGRPAEFSPLLMSVVGMIQNHPTIEVSNDPREDKVLIGLMNLVCTLVSKDKQFKILAGSPKGGNLVLEIFHKCLFDIPQQSLKEGDNLESLMTRKRDPVTPPRCKTPASRATAYRLLEELVRDVPTNFEVLINNLIEQHILVQPRDQWAYQPAGYEKAPCGYVGLKNMGATCYMNSLMQQFFMIPQFRYGILSAPVRSPDKQESLLYQLQAIFVHLQESEKKFYDPKSFCKAYKPDGQPVNPSVQMDVDEFFNMLFDKLETLLKGTPQETILKHFFGGTIVNQIISRECEHTSEREESFFTFSVEVKNKRNLLESLDLFVQGDMLEGDNKYHCSTCNKKVDAMKRCCIKSLPNNLIIHLKRFEFDLELMRRTKVNEYCEFPLKLNLEPYTLEGITRREALAKSKDQQMLPPVRPLEHYDYELTGILVHTGTAESGHYYSFIRERDPPPGAQPRWFHFNDMLVEPFDPNEIGAQCFGGNETTSVWDSVQNKRITKQQLKPNNAYMLFYSKVIPNPEPAVNITLDNSSNTKSLRSSKTYTQTLPLISENTPQSNVTTKSSYIIPSNFPLDLFAEVWKENTQFLHDKHIFDPAYFSFIRNIFEIVKTLPSQPSTNYSDDIHQKEGAPFDPVFKTIELGTRFFVETLAHAKDRETMNDLLNSLINYYSNHIQACKWFLNTMIKTDYRWVKHILFHSPISDIREKFVKLLVHVIVTLAPYERNFYFEEEPIDAVAMEIEKEPEKEVETKLQLSKENEEKEEASLLFLKPKGVPKALIIRFMDSYLSLLKEAHRHWRNFAQYFLMLEDFARLGPREREYLLARKAISVLADFYLDDDSPRVNNGKRAKSNKKTKIEKAQVANMRHIVGCLSVLIRSCAVPFSTTKVAPPAGTTLDDNMAQQPLESPSMYQIPGDLHPFDPEDWEMVTSDVFLERIIGDGVYLAASADLVCHLCWENETISNRVITLMNDRIDRLDYDLCRPYYFVFSRVLRIRDSLQRHRIVTAMTRFLEVIAKNLKTKNATYASVKFLLDNCPLLPDLRDFLYQNMKNWTEELLFYKHFENVRYAAEALVMALIPEIPSYNTGLPKEDFTTFTAAEISPFLESTSVTDQSQQVPQLSGSVTAVGLETDPAKIDERFRNIYRHLLTLLAPARNYTVADPKNFTKTADEGYPPGFWRLISLMRLLDWGMKSDREKLMFGEYMDDFFKLMTTVDQQQLECDQNKLYMTALLDKATENCPDNVRRIVEEERFGVRSFDWFISLRNCPAFISYNDEQIHHAYNVYLRCIEMDPTFAEKWCLHRNFDWNTRYLYIEPCEYPKTAERQHKILAAAFKSPNGPKFRQILINKICSLYEKVFSSNFKNILNLSNLCMQTTEDKLLFIERKSPHFLSKMILAVNWMEGDHVNPWLSTIIDFLNRQLECLTNDNLPDRVVKVKKELLNSWNDRIKLVSLLVDYNFKYSNEETLLLSSRRFLLTLCKLDSSCLEHALSLFFEHHDSQRDTTCTSVTTAQSMETEHDQKTLTLYQHYYIFVSKLALCGIDSFTKQTYLLEQSIGLLSLVALETLNMPTSIILPVVQNFDMCWSVSVSEVTVRSVLKHNSDFITFVAYLLSKYVHHLDQKEIAQFATNVFQEVKMNLSKEIKNMVKFYVLKLEVLLQQLTSLSHAADNEIPIETVVSNLISFLRGVRILSGDVEFNALLSQCADEKMKLFRSFISSIDKTPLVQSKRKEELLEIVNDFNKISS
jgi:ubiquitin carboxyl-terminal hydrolase 34